VAIGPPMLPKPKNATFDIGIPNSDSGQA